MFFWSLVALCPSFSGVKFLDLSPAVFFALFRAFLLFLPFRTHMVDLFPSVSTVSFSLYRVQSQQAPSIILASKIGYLPVQFLV